MTLIRCKVKLKVTGFLTSENYQSRACTVAAMTVSPLPALSGLIGPLSSRMSKLTCSCCRPGIPGAVDFLSFFSNNIFARRRCRTSDLQIALDCFFS